MNADPVSVAPLVKPSARAYIAPWRFRDNYIARSYYFDVQDRGSNGRGRPESDVLFRRFLYRPLATSITRLPATRVKRQEF